MHAIRYSLYSLCGGLVLLLGLMMTTIPAVAQGCAGAPESRIERGEQAQVIVANGSNLRRRPSSGELLLNIIPPGEVVPVLDGPFCAQGYTWWQVQYNDDRGWVAEGTPDNYWLAPYVLKTVQLDTFAITIPPEIAADGRPRYDAGRVVISLEGYPVTHPIYAPEIRVFRTLPDYDEVRRVRAALFEGDRSALDDVALTPLTYINFADGTGVRYISLFVDTAGGDNTAPTLLYSFRGISRDNRYVSFNLPVDAPGLPLPVDDRRGEADRSDYIESTRAAVQAIPPLAFTPNLNHIDRMAQSITTSAVPLPLADRLQTFRSDDGLTIQYLPEVTGSIGVDTVRAQGDNPRHLRVRLEDYAVDDGRSAYIRIYRTDTVDSNWLVGLQLLLSQQPRQPNRIPILSRQDATPQRVEQVEYLPFQSGTGIRALLTYDGDAWWYSYQALTADNQFYVSVLLPLAIIIDGTDISVAPPTDFQPNLNSLDVMIQSISTES